MKTVFRAIGLALILGIVPIATTAAAPAQAPIRTTIYVNWMSYLNHSIAATDTWLSLLDDESWALDTGDDHLIGQADLALRNHARTQYRWYSSHTPKNSCFNKVWASEKLAAHYYDIAFTNLARYWLNWPNVGQSVFNTGLRYEGLGTRQTKRTTALIPKANC